MEQEAQTLGAFQSNPKDSKGTSTLHHACSCSVTSLCGYFVEAKKKKKKIITVPSCFSSCCEAVQKLIFMGIYMPKIQPEEEKNGWTKVTNYL